ncbi:unnamed protein product [Closterium sp. Naga37s-1]|nr:unnamed protein product [Closterium sp. Naga37s-1]
MRPDEAGQLKYRNTRHAVTSMWRLEGARGFYKGFLPNLLRVMPSASITFAVYEGKVKQIVGSTLRDLPSQDSPATDSSSSSSSSEPVTNFESDRSAAEYASMYAGDSLPGGHVIMLGADPASQAAALGALNAFPGGLHVGGGITPENAGMYLDAGASHVIVTSYVFREGAVDEERLRRMVNAVAPERLGEHYYVVTDRWQRFTSLVASFSISLSHTLVHTRSLTPQPQGEHYYVVTDRWQRFTSLVVDGESLARLADCCDEFLVHGVDVEGMKLGIDEELVSLLGKYSPIPVTYVGGVRSLEDLDIVKAAGRGAVDVTVGSALDIFGGDLPYREVVEWHRSQEKV